MYKIIRKLLLVFIFIISITVLVGCDLSRFTLNLSGDDDEDNQGNGQPQEVVEIDVARELFEYYYSTLSSAPYSFNLWYSLYQENSISFVLRDNTIYFIDTSTNRDYIYFNLNALNNNPFNLQIIESSNSIYVKDNNGNIIFLFSYSVVDVEKEFSVQFFNEGVLLKEVNVKENVTLSSAFSKASLSTTLSKNGFEFLGWYVDKLNRVITSSELYTIRITDNIKLYAEWREVTVVDEYFDVHINDGHGNIKDVRVKKNSLLSNVLTENGFSVNPKYEGAKFDFWKVNNVYVESSETYTYRITKNLDILAQWTSTRNIYLQIWDGENGSIIAEGEVPYGLSLGDSIAWLGVSPRLEVEGRVFLGWFVDTFNFYIDGPAMYENVLTSDTKIYAQYDGDINHEITVTVIDGNNQTSFNVPHSTRLSDALKQNGFDVALEKEGYEFLYWELTSPHFSENIYEVNAYNYGLYWDVTIRPIWKVSDGDNTLQDIELVGRDIVTSNNNITFLENNEYKLRLKKGQESDEWDYFGYQFPNGFKKGYNFLKVVFRGPTNERIIFKVNDSIDFSVYCTGEFQDLTFDFDIDFDYSKLFLVIFPACGRTGLSEEFEFCNITFVANVNPVIGYNTVNLNGGHFKTYKNIDEIKQDFIEDYNYYLNVNYDINTIPTSSWSPVDFQNMFFANDEIRAKWHWLLVFLARNAYGNINKQYLNDMLSVTTLSDFESLHADTKYSLSYEVRAFLTGNVFREGNTSYQSNYYNEDLLLEAFNYYNSLEWLDNYPNNLDLPIPYYEGYGFTGWEIYGRLIIANWSQLDYVYYGGNNPRYTTKNVSKGSSIEDQQSVVGVGTKTVIIGDKVFVLPKYALIDLGKNYTSNVTLSTKEELQVYGTDGTEQNSTGIVYDLIEDGVTVYNSYGHGALYYNSSNYQITISNVENTYGRNLFGASYGYNRYIFKYITDDLYQAILVVPDDNSQLYYSNVQVVLQPGDFLWCPMTAERFCTGLTDCDGPNGVKGSIVDGGFLRIVDTATLSLEQPIQGNEVNTIILGQYNEILGMTIDSLEEAMNYIKENGVIYIPANKYCGGDVTINKSVAIIGVDSDAGVYDNRSNTSSLGGTITIDADNVIFDGLTLEGYTTIKIINGENIHFENCLFIEITPTNNASIILVENATNVYVVDCLFINRISDIIYRIINVTNSITNLYVNNNYIDINPPQGVGSGNEFVRVNNLVGDFIFIENNCEAFATNIWYIDIRNASDASILIKDNIISGRANYLDEPGLAFYNISENSIIQIMNNEFIRVNGNTLRFDSPNFVIPVIVSGNHFDENTAFKMRAYISDDFIVFSNNTYDCAAIGDLNGNMPSDYVLDINTYSDLSYFKYSIDESNKTITILGLANQDDSETIYIEFLDVYNINGIDYTVTEIADFAFSIWNLKSIILPKTLKKIGMYAFFGCQKLKSITIPDSVEEIREAAFGGTGITSIFIPENVNTIGACLFIDCISLTSVEVSPYNKEYDSRDNCNAVIEKKTNKLLSSSINSIIPSGVKIIGFNSYYRSTIRNLSIPEGVEIIEEGAIRCCYDLETVYIPSSVSYIGLSNFEDCDNLRTIVVDTNNNTYDSRDNCNAIIETATNELIAGSNYTVIPRSVTSIGDNAFIYRRYITTLELHEGLTSIGNGSFQGASSLTTLIIPSTLTEIGYAAFNDCCNLTSIIVSPDNPKYYSTNNTLMERDTYTLLLTNSEGIIPEETRIIGNHLLMSRYHITNITLPSLISSIGHAAFMSCSSLESIVIPKSVTEIDSQAFDQCYKLNKVYYTGTEEEWNAIDIRDYNDALFNAIIIFNYNGGSGN